MLANTANRQAITDAQAAKESAKSPRWCQAGRWARLQMRAGAVLVAGIAISGLALWLFRDRTGLLANALGWPVLSFGIGLLVFAAADRSSLIGRRAVPGAGWLAGISYSLYLSHKIAFHLVQVHLAPALQGHGLLLFAVYGLSAVLLGASLHYLVERPFLKLRERRLALTTSVQTAVAEVHRTAQQSA